MRGMTMVQVDLPPEAVEWAQAHPDQFAAVVLRAAAAGGSREAAVADLRARLQARTPERTDADYAGARARVRALLARSQATPVRPGAVRVLALGEADGPRLYDAVLPE